MNTIRSFFKQLFCSHEFKHLRNIHGDEINMRGGYRSIWKCIKCDDTIKRRSLHYE